jgi:transcriptional regulator with XRE-family HTH domain
MIDSKDLARVMLMHRKAAGLSRIQLSEMAGVGKTVIYDIEKGKETVQLATLGKILKVLNIRMVFQSPLLDELQTLSDEKS